MYRIININKILNYFNLEGIRGIESLIGKSEALVFEDNESKKIIRLYSKGKYEKATTLIQQYVS